MCYRGRWRSLCSSVLLSWWRIAEQVSGCFSNVLLHTNILHVYRIITPATVLTYAILHKWYADVAMLNTVCMKCNHKSLTFILIRNLVRNKTLQGVISSRVVWCSSTQSRFKCCTQKFIIVGWCVWYHSYPQGSWLDS